MSDSEIMVDDENQFVPNPYIFIDFSITNFPTAFESIDLGNTVIVASFLLFLRKFVVRPKTCWDVVFF